MADDTTILGTAHIQSSRSGNIFQRATGRGATGNVSASLKFDIPGLKDFKSQLEAINKSLEQLDKTFARLAKAPEAFSKSLENSVRQMKALQAAQVQGNRFVTTGTPPSKDPVGQATAAAQSTGSGGGAGGGGVAGAVGQAVNKAVQQVTTAMFKRFDANMQQAIGADVYASRMAMYAGGGSPRTSAGIFRQEGRNGFGFMATDMVQGNAVQYQGTAIGGYMGASGVAGQKFGAYATSIKQMQEVMPGLDAQQGASAQTAILNNVQGIKMARAMLGPTVTPYGANGQNKTQGEYFRGILTALQKMPRPNGQNGAWTKDDIMRMNFPGSRLNAWLSAILPAEAIPMWMEWAIANAAVGGLSDDPNQAKKQLEGVRGRSLATNAQETQNRAAQQEATFTGQQYGTMNARMDYEKQMIGILQSIDGVLKDIYAVTGRVPGAAQGGVSKGLGMLAGGLVGGGIGFLLGGPAGAVVGAGLGMSATSGDPGYMGDPGFMGDPEGGTSHLTPDLRKRVNAMMQANPSLMISSSFRDSRRQQSLQGKGPFAPSGKSKHGRGQAVDFGNQLGWVAKNARKFGLETAARYGEPWHVQLAGTTTMGDPIDPSAMARKTEDAQRTALITGVQARWAATSSTTASGGTGGTGAANTGAAGNGGASTGTGGALDLGKGSMTAEQVVQTLYNAGFRGDSLITMAGIANRESGWTPSAHRSNRDKSLMVGDLGLLQINYSNIPGLIKAGVISSNADLFDPAKNAAAAFFLARGGSNLAPWTAGKGGWQEGGDAMYGVKQSALDAARTAAQGLGYMGDAGYAPAMGGGGGNVTMQGGAQITFHNTFQLSFPNGASQGSIKVAAQQIGRELKSQMSTAVSRSN